MAGPGENAARAGAALANSMNPGSAGDPSDTAALAGILPETTPDEEKIENLEKPVSKKIFLSYPKTSINPLGSNALKYVMNINIFRQLKTPSVRALAETSNLDQKRFERRAGQGIEPIDTTTAMIALGGYKVIEQVLSGVVNPLASAVASGLTTLGTAGTNAIFNDKVGLDRKTETNPLAYISLYMPESLTFTDVHNFNPLSLTDAMGTVGLLKQAGATSREAIARLGEFTGLFNSGFVDASQYQQGFAINPQLLLLYKGSSNRQFVFQFRFVPRDADEAEEIADIIRTLRYHAAPDFQPGTTSRYFVPPSEFEIEFLFNDPEYGYLVNNKLPRLGQSVLSNVDVNYAPNGFYAAHKDGMPTEIQVQLTFTETVILTKTDIGSLGY